MTGEGFPQLRIGELSRRVDVPPTLLRAWERRYGLLKPTRSEGNFRLYSLDDVARVWAMKAHLERGHAAAEAARLALADRAADSGAPFVVEAAPAVQELREALVRFDEARAQRLLDRAFALHELEHVLAEIVLPCLRQIGEQWARNEVGVAQEHFASTLLRSRLLALAQGWNTAPSPAAALACAPGEQHDIGLISFGLALWRRGWRILYIGQDTPVEQLRRVASSVPVSLVVVAAHTSEPFSQHRSELEQLATEVRLAIAGAGATPEIAALLGASRLNGDAVAAAATID